MELNYKIPTKPYYLEYSDEYEFDYKELVYVVSDKEIESFLLEKIYQDYFADGMYDIAGKKDIIRYLSDFIFSLGLFEKIKEFYYDEIKENFKNEAIKFGTER